MQIFRTDSVMKDPRSIRLFLGIQDLITDSQMIICTLAAAALDETRIIIGSTIPETPARVVSIQGFTFLKLVNHSYISFYSFILFIASVRGKIRLCQLK